MKYGNIQCEYHMALGGWAVKLKFVVSITKEEMTVSLCFCLRIIWNARPQDLRTWVDPEFKPTLEGRGEGQKAQNVTWQERDQPPTRLVRRKWHMDLVASSFKAKKISFCKYYFVSDGFMIFKIMSPNKPCTWWHGHQFSHYDFLTVSH